MPALIQKLSEKKLIYNFYLNFDEHDNIPNKLICPDLWMPTQDVTHHNRHILAGNRQDFLLQNPFYANKIILLFFSNNINKMPNNFFTLKQKVLLIILKAGNSILKT